MRKNQSGEFTEAGRISVSLGLRGSASGVKSTFLCLTLRDRHGSRIGQFTLSTDIAAALSADLSASLLSARRGDVVRKVVTASFDGEPGSGKSLLMSLLRQDLDDMGIPHRQSDEECVEIGPLTDAQKEWIAKEVAS
ncbi:hypothetical protein [Tardiphaga robiniae]|uniref:hypothetical protein n=1 Tax=Tardiphaga robiniae TaxID=943830 RepID=UPI0015867588|nr:hypothetical protein [Tardiphaga robiniae]NUU41395.1 hypothetical protein [Tardiphaga robiniae]